MEKDISKIKQKIALMLEKIDDARLLNRIYQFIKYIYIHQA